MADMENINDLSSDFNIEIADLSEQGQEQVHDLIEAASDIEGHVDADTVTDAISAAEEADVHREAAVEHQQAQAEAVEAGDYEAARDHAQAAEYEIQEVADLGGEDNTVAQGEEVANLEWADYHQDIADDAAASAADYAESGDLAAAEVYADTAASHTETATDYADMGDHGGTYATDYATTDTSSTDV